MCLLVFHTKTTEWILMKHSLEARITHILEFINILIRVAMLVCAAKPPRITHIMYHENIYLK